MASDNEPRKGRLTFDPNTIGTTGLRSSGGYVVEEFLPALRGARGARVYQEMADNDATVGAVLFAVTMLIRSIEWSVQAVDDSDEAEAAKVFVEECLGDMSVSMSAVVSEICTMFVHGFAPLEIVWKRRKGPAQTDPTKRSAFTDGKIGIRNLALRSQTTVFKWELDPEDGSILGLWQQPMAGPQVFIPIQKLLLFRTTENKNNPEGRSLLRNSYRAWYFKKKIEEIEAIGVERDLAGLPVAYIPGYLFSKDASDSDKAQRARWEEIVTKLRQDTMAGITIPSDRDASGNLIYDLRLLSTGGTRQFNTTQVIDRYNRAIATSVLADFLFLGQQAVGSFALSSDKTALFATAISSLSKSVAEVFSSHLLPRLFELNAMDLELCPTLKPGDLQKVNLAEIGDFIVKLVQAGAQLFPDRELENGLRAMAGLPEAPEDGSGLGDQGVPGQGQPGDQQDPIAALAAVLNQAAKPGAKAGPGAQAGGEGKPGEKPGDNAGQPGARQREAAA